MSTLTSETATDLVSEIRSEQRQQRMRRIVRILVVLFVVAALAVAAKLLFDRHRLASNLDACQEHLARGGHDDLDQAEAALRANLALDDGHTRSLAALALVQANRALVFGTDPAIAAATLEATDSNSTDAELARAMLSLVEDRRQDSRTILADLDEGDELLPGAATWLRARLALHTPADTRAIAEHLAALVAVIDAGPEAVGAEYERTAAGLAYRTGDVEAASTRIAAARGRHPANLGLAVDELLLDAELHRRPDELDALAQALLARTDLAPPDRARVGLARTLLRCHAADRDACAQGLKDAWGALPAWDHDARERTLATAVLHGLADRIRAWLEEERMGETMTGIYGAGADFAEGAVVDTLEKLQSLPQEHPRVAQLQALALVSQERFDEATPWIDRAIALLPERPELTVAKARVAAQTDAAAALETLTEVAEAHPGALRVHTAIGQAHLSSLADDADRKQRQAVRGRAAEAFQTALKQEPWPAEAGLQLAILEMIEAWDEPPRAADALALLEQAAKSNPHAAKYRAELGIYLADLGFSWRAEPLLRGITEAPDAPARALLRLVRLLTDQGPLSEEDLASSAKWLADAGKTGAEAADLQRHQARIELAQGEDALLDAAMRRLTAMLDADRRDLETRLLLADAQVRIDPDEAKHTLRVGLRVTPRNDEARIHYRLAVVEERRKKARNAASMAFRAFRAMIKERRPPFEVFEVAEFTRDIWMEIGQVKGARTIGRDLTKYVPYHPASWVLRGRIQLAAEYPDWALESAQKAIEIDAEFAPGHALQGECLAQRGRIDEAKAAYEKAIELGREDPQRRQWETRLRRLSK